MVSPTPFIALISKLIGHINLPMLPETTFKTPKELQIALGERVRRLFPSGAATPEKLNAHDGKQGRDFGKRRCAILDQAAAFVQPSKRSIRI